jgi:hypothetical protein
MALTTIRQLPRFVLVLVTTCSLLIAACGSAGLANPEASSFAGCQGADCRVDVNVNNCVVSPFPDPIPVPPSNNVIKWTIKATDGTGYHFPHDGIRIKGPSDSGIKPDPGVIGNGKMFVMHDDHTVHGPIPYAVLVVRDSNGVACPLLDPIILNQ